MRRVAWVLAVGTFAVLSVAAVRAVFTESAPSLASPDARTGGVLEEPALACAAGETTVRTIIDGVDVPGGPIAPEDAMSWWLTTYTPSLSMTDIDLAAVDDNEAIYTRTESGDTTAVWGVALDGDSWSVMHWAGCSGFVDAHVVFEDDN